ncbi:MAG: single-stranded DNA-binding protein, partial [Pseudoflavonifractor sp.]
GRGSRLVITLYARTLLLAGGAHSNELVLAGVLCKPPTVRRTPLGREICDLMLAVNRKYGRADYLPCIAWGILAEHCGDLTVGDGVRLEGRLQSRVYTKVENGEGREKTAYEISVMKLDRVEECCP